MVLHVDTVCKMEMVTEVVADGAMVFLENFIANWPGHRRKLIGKQRGS